MCILNQATSDHSLALCLQEEVVPVGKGWGHAGKTEDEANAAHASSDAHPLHAAPGAYLSHTRCMSE